MNIVRISEVPGVRFQVHVLNVDRPLCGAGGQLTQQWFNEVYRFTSQPVNCTMCLKGQK